MSDVIVLFLICIILILWSIEDKIEQGNLTEAQKVELQKQEEFQLKAEKEVELQKEERDKEILAKTWGDLEGDETVYWLFLHATNSIFAKIMLVGAFLVGFASFTIRSHDRRYN